MKNKILTISIMLMCLGVFAGCNKIPTAEELVTNAFGTPQEAVDMDVLMNIQAGAEAEGFSMDLSVDMDFNIKTDKVISCIDGTLTIGMLGMDMSQDMKIWTDESSSMTYTYNSMYDCWIKESVSEEETTAVGEFKPEVFEELLLAEVGDEDTEYVVTAVINLKNAYDMMGMEPEDIVGSMEGFNIEDIVMDVTMRFDRETEAFKSMTMVAKEETLASMSTEEAAFKAMSLEMIVNEITEPLALKIPAEVIEEAVDAKEMEEALLGL